MRLRVLTLANIEDDSDSSMNFKKTKEYLSLSPMANFVNAAVQSRKRKREHPALTIADTERARGRPVTPFHLLFECATGYALFLANGITQVNTLKFEAVDEYLNRSPQPLELIAYLPFSSDHDALVQMNAISKSIVTQKLIDFISKHSPKPISIGILDAHMSRTGLTCQCSLMFNNVMRGLREKIHQFILLQPGELERAQINLACLHIKFNQKITQMDTKSPVVVSSSSIQEKVGVVPHGFEGVFTVKGEKDILCTRNLVPGEALYGEKLIHVQNEDITEVEYRVWDPLRSKLGAAVHRDVTNIWIKPGSRVL